MKKVLYLSMILILAINITACNKETKYIQSELDQIFEISEAYSYTDSEDDVAQHKNVMAEKAVSTLEKEVGEKSIFYSASKEIPISYEQTLFYPVGDVKIHVHKIDNTENSRILLYEDGSLNSILNGDIASILISPHSSPEQVKAELEPAIQKFVDLSEYQYCTISPTTRQDGTYSLYRFTYYNEVHGYRTNFVRILVLPDGRVATIRFSLPLPDLTTIDFVQLKERHKDAILLKLKDMFNTSKSEYRTHEISGATVVVYQGEVYIRYLIKGEALHSTINTECGFACNLLIPARL
ncbi:MAG: hypothetical protein E7454_03625 [Ruminococcaceae bacterium]|nr:hypothetical protein [Oscillospiraceae bacterium]